MCVCVRLIRLICCDMPAILTWICAHKLLALAPLCVRGPASHQMFNPKYKLPLTLHLQLLLLLLLLSLSRFTPFRSVPIRSDRIRSVSIRQRSRWRRQFGAYVSGARRAANETIYCTRCVSLFRLLFPSVSLYHSRPVSLPQPFSLHAVVAGIKLNFPAKAQERHFKVTFYVHHTPSSRHCSELDERSICCNFLKLIITLQITKTNL